MTKKRKDLRSSWEKAILTFLFPVLLVFSVRWLLFEPFVIPSGSMLPNLLINDHILVSKWSFGFRLPFAKKYVMTWSQPQRGDVVVFRYPLNPEVYYVKRVLALAGDEVEIQYGEVRVNGVALSLEPVEGEDGFQTFKESGRIVRFLNREASNFEKTKVPEGHYFLVGDNRDQSNDSRSWGFVPQDLLVGKAFMIWLSCDQMMATAQFLCEPATIRWDRVGLRL
jgi:signal peptidase I